MLNIAFTSFAESVPKLLTELGATEVLKQQETILIKPNLINTFPPPVTTPVEVCEALVDFIRTCSQAGIVIAEGCGDPGLTTHDIFDRLGYTDLANRLDIQLIDLNNAPLQQVNDPTRPVFPEMYLPRIVFQAYLISVPVLKAHSLAGMTGTLKNMIGIAPPRYYVGRSGSWNKAAFHADLQQAILDLASYRPPDLTLMDASIGLAAYHLGGPPCSPPLGRLLAGFDPWEIDRAGAGLLALDWRKIGHLQGGEKMERARRGLS